MPVNAAQDASSYSATAPRTQALSTGSAQAPNAGGTVGSMQRSNATASTGELGYTNCTPEQLYFHVVGRWPANDLGGYLGSGGVGSSSTGVVTDPTGASGVSDLATDVPVGGTSDSANLNGDAGRAKKRRKVQRRAKVSEIWFPRAELAFCTCVAGIPPNGRTKIKFFGRPLGRNELIAAICTLATRRLYNRKQISSHSQVLKDKVPPPYKEIFTFEDKARGPDEPAENSSANIVENYPFPDSIYDVIGYPIGTDLANAAKPAWLVELEAGGTDTNQGTTGDSSRTPYSYWGSSQAPEYSSYYDRDSVYKKEREGRLSESGVAQPGNSVDSSYYSYQYSQPHSRQMQVPSLPPPFAMHQAHNMRDESLGDTMNGNRYSFSSSTSSHPAPSNVTPRGLWDGNDRSPASSTSAFDQQSAPGVSPRHAANPFNQQWMGDPRPPMSSRDSSGDQLTLAPLQDMAPMGPPYGSATSWKDRQLYSDPTKWASQSAAPASTTRGGVGNGLPSLSTLPPFGSSQTSTGSHTYGAVPGWMTGSGSGMNPGQGQGQGGWDVDKRPVAHAQQSLQSQTSERLSISRTALFTPLSVEMTAHSADTVVGRSLADTLMTAAPMPWHSVYMWRARYPFLEQIAANAPSFPVFHIDMPLALPSDPQARLALLERTVELGLQTTLRLAPSADGTGGWAMSTDSGFVQPRGVVRYQRHLCSLRNAPNGAASSAGPEVMSGFARLPDLARLYDHLTRMGVNGGTGDEASVGSSGSIAMGDALAGVGAPMTILVQRVVRESPTELRAAHEPTMPIGADWGSAVALIIYSLWVAEDDLARSVPVCRTVDFDPPTPARPEEFAADQLVADLLAGEESRPSKFEWV